MKCVYWVNATCLLAKEKGVSNGESKFKTGSYDMGNTYSAGCWGACGYIYNVCFYAVSSSEKIFENRIWQSGGQWEKEMEKKAYKVIS